jgi:hypothetical protein
MPYDGRPADLDAPIGTLRLVGREKFERRAEVDVPSATGGAPKTQDPNDPFQPVAGSARPTNESPTPRRPVLPGVFRSPDEQRPDFTQDAPFVQFLTARIEESAVKDQSLAALAESVGGPLQLAQRIMAMMYRATDVNRQELVLPDRLYHTSRGRAMGEILDRITRGA